MNPPRRLRGTFGMCNLREGFVNLREGFVVAPWRLREAFSKTRSAKASRRRHGRLHLETIRQIMTSPQKCPHHQFFFCEGESCFLLSHKPLFIGVLIRNVRIRKKNVYHWLDSICTCYKVQAAWSQYYIIYILYCMLLVRAAVSLYTIYICF